MLELEWDLLSFIKQAQVMFFDSGTRDEIIERMVANLAKLEILSDSKGFYELILAREKVVSTGIGMGIALPHAKMASVENFFLSIGIHKGGGVDWQAIDGLPVKMIFLIGGPLDRHKEYLQLLSLLTKALKDEKRRGQLIRAKNTEEVVKIFDS